MKSLFGMTVLLTSLVGFAQTSHSQSQSKQEVLVRCSGYLVARNGKNVLVKVILARETTTSFGSGQRELSVSVESQSPDQQLSLKEIVVTKNSKIATKTTYQTLNLNLSVSKNSKPGNVIPANLQISQRLRPQSKPQPIGEATLNCR